MEEEKLCCRKPGEEGGMDGWPIAYIGIVYKHAYGGPAGIVWYCTYGGPASLVWCSSMVL